MSDEHEHQGTPIKETLYALVGVGLFVAVAGLVIVSAWFRPAGDHYEVISEEVTSEVVEDTSSN